MSIFPVTFEDDREFTAKQFATWLAVGATARLTYSSVKYLKVRRSIKRMKTEFDLKTLDDFK